MSVADGEVPAFDQVFEQHVDYVWRVLRHLGVPERDRDDLTQEVFLVVHKRLPEFQPHASLRTWLWAIAWRVAKAGARRARRAPLEFTPSGDEALVSAGPSPERSAAGRQSMRRLDDVLASLEALQRQIFLLHEVEGITMRAITEGMGCPLQTGYSRLRLAREKVRRAFSEVPHV